MRCFRSRKSAVQFGACQLAFVAMAACVLPDSDDARGRSVVIADSIGSRLASEASTIDTTVRGIQAAKVDWNVGPLSGLSWEVTFGELGLALRNVEAPDDAMRYVREHASPRTVRFRTIASEHFDFHGVPIRSRELYFDARRLDVDASDFPREPERPRASAFNVREVQDGYRGEDRDVERFMDALDRYAAERKRYDEQSFDAMHAVEVAMRQAVMGAGLVETRLYPAGGFNLVRNQLSNAFGAQPVTRSRTLPLPAARVTWRTSEWQDRYSLVKFVTILRDGDLVARYVSLTKEADPASARPLALASMQLADSAVMDQVLSELQERDWAASYGWIRQRLGASPDATNWTFPASCRSRRHLFYPLRIEDDLIAVFFLFDSRDQLESIELLPNPVRGERITQPDSSLDASRCSRLRQDSLAAEPARVLAERLRAEAERVEVERTRRDSASRGTLRLVPDDGTWVVRLGGNRLEELVGVQGTVVPGIAPGSYTVSAFSESGPSRLQEFIPYQSVVTVDSGATVVLAIPARRSSRVSLAFEVSGAGPATSTRSGAFTLLAAGGEELDGTFVVTIRRGEVGRSRRVEFTCRAEVTVRNSTRTFSPAQSEFSFPLGIGYSGVEVSCRGAERLRFMSTATVHFGVWQRSLLP